MRLFLQAERELLRYVMELVPNVSDARDVVAAWRSLRHRSERMFLNKSTWARFPEFGPGHGVNAHGFDEAWVYHGGGADYFTRRTVKGKGPVSWWHNLDFRPQDEGYTDDLITQHAIEFIHENKARPFFCYVPFHLVHAPLQARKDDLAAMDPKVTASLPAAKAGATPEEKHTHAAMLHALDKDVAAILAELDKLGLRDNTIVFTSDNGAMEAGSSLPLVRCSRMSGCAQWLRLKSGSELPFEGRD